MCKLTSRVSGTIIFFANFSIAKNFKSWVATDTKSLAKIFFSIAVNLKCIKNQNKLKTDAVTLTFARGIGGSFDFREVAASSYLGAKALQWPHLGYRKQIS